MTVHIPPAAMRGIQARQAVIEQHQHIVTALQAELASFVSKQLGVNLEDGDWRLNPDQGVLERVNGTNTQQSQIGVGVPAADSPGYEGTEAVGS